MNTGRDIRRLSGMRGCSDVFPLNLYKTGVERKRNLIFGGPVFIGKMRV
jgi:hypothetical protein